MVSLHNALYLIGGATFNEVCPDSFYVYYP